jgi:hypothetical protein
MRERLVDERERLVEVREYLVERRERLAAARVGERGRLTEQILRVRDEAAERAERIAEQAEAYAAYLESSATSEGDRDRLSRAKAERTIAAVERRNAAKLRSAGIGAVHLESVSQRRSSNQSS